MYDFSGPTAEENNSYTSDGVQTHRTEGVLVVAR